MSLHQPSSIGVEHGEPSGPNSRTKSGKLFFAWRTNRFSLRVEDGAKYRSTHPLLISPSPAALSPPCIYMASCADASATFCRSVPCTAPLPRLLALLPSKTPASIP